MLTRLANILAAAGLPLSDPRGLSLSRTTLLSLLMTYALDVRDDELAAAINEELENIARSQTPRPFIPPQYVR